MANKPTAAWNEDKPEGERDLALGDDDIREFKTQVREILEVDHEIESSGQGEDWGKHNKVTLIVQATDPDAVADAAIVFSKDVGAKAEVHTKDEDGNVVQLTKAGALFVKDGTTTETSAAPTVDSGIANKKYVDDKTAAITLPAGVITLWSGAIADIPSGWYLCNGSNGTPDLRDKFVVGAKEDVGGVPKSNIEGSLNQEGGDTSHDHGAATGLCPTPNGVNTGATPSQT
jgi:hypothetical protein